MGPPGLAPTTGSPTAGSIALSSAPVRNSTLLLAPALTTACHERRDLPTTRHSLRPPSPPLPNDIRHCRPWLPTTTLLHARRRPAVRAEATAPSDDPLTCRSSLGLSATPRTARTAAHPTTGLCEKRARVRGIREPVIIASVAH